MLSVLFIVIVTYLLAAESFTHFLFPAPGEVARHFRAGALPVALFDLLVTAFALVIIVGWILIYAASHGRTIHMPQWAKKLQLNIYLLLMNRLYLDALSMRLRAPIASAIDQLNRSRLFPYIVGLLAIGLTLAIASPVADLSPAQIAQMIALALLLPLFPVHGVYVAAVTRAPRYLSPALALLLPALGTYWLAHFSSNLPVGLLGAVKWLALLGALYGSLKALAQVSVPPLIAYASLALYSVLWWGFAANTTFISVGFLYAGAMALLSAGLLLAWQFLRKRYGDLELDRFHGLARPMPRFATLFSLFVMAAVGLPPFALFSAQLEILLQPSLMISWGLAVILFTWFLASWYLVRMMHRLLFGHHQIGTRYTDLHAGETIWLALLLALLVLLGAAPSAWFELPLRTDIYRTALEPIRWHK